VYSSSPATLSLRLPASPNPSQPHTIKPGCTEGRRALPQWKLGVEMIMKGIYHYLWTWHVELQGSFDVFTAERQKERHQRGKKDRDQHYSAESYASAFHFPCSFGHFELLLSLLTSPKDLIHSHHQPLHKRLKSITDGFTEESFNLTFRIITGLHTAPCHQRAKQSAPGCSMTLIHTRRLSENPLPFSKKWLPGKPPGHSDTFKSCSQEQVAGTLTVV